MAGDAASNRVRETAADASRGRPALRTRVSAVAAWTRRYSELCGGWASLATQTMTAVRVFVSPMQRGLGIAVGIAIQMRVVPTATIVELVTRHAACAVIGKVSAPLAERMRTVTRVGFAPR